MAAARIASGPAATTVIVSAAALALLTLSGCAVPGRARSPAAPRTAARPPNIVVILADDLGFGDLGVYGQSLIATPRLDQMAAQGMRFRQFYAGAPVCAPSRAVLLTGKHTGHARVRGNARGDIQQLRPEDVTIAEVLRGVGYQTALVGKWGLGEDGSAGHPNRQGFQQFFGYLNQTHAHNYYPDYLWRNEVREALPNVVEPTPSGSGDPGGYARRRVVYSHDLFVDEALRFINHHGRAPFFLTLALTIPHANNEATAALGDGQEVPDHGDYATRAWPDPAKGQAAMITRLDRDVGRILDQLDALNLSGDTLVMFTSDNGPHNEGGFDPALFRPSGPLRGQKRHLYEGGIRVPLIVRWPGHTPPGTISDHIGYSGDLMATLAELAGAAPPSGIDSLSFAATLTGRASAQAKHDHLYWEFYEQAGAQAVRLDRWKAVRTPFGTGPIELYDLLADPVEARDLAPRQPEIVALMEAIMRADHVPDPVWKPSGTRRPPPPPGQGSLPF